MACFRAKFTLNWNKQITVTQMKEEGLRKIILLARPEAKRGTGRPKMKWVDSVDQESERTGERNGRRRARNRDKWKKASEEVRNPARAVEPITIIVMTMIMMIISYMRYVTSNEASEEDPEYCVGRNLEETDFSVLLEHNPSGE
jgi:hypothetical protein